MATIDKNKYSSGNGQVPLFPNYGFTVTKSDTDMYDPGIFLYCGGAGNVACVADNDDSNTTVTVVVVAGGMVPFRVKQVLAATTATGLIGVL